MKKRKPEIESMIEEIRNRGGIVGVSQEISDQQLKSFLEAILECPDCKEESRQRARRLPTREH